VKPDSKVVLKMLCRSLKRDFGSFSNVYVIN